MRVSFFFPAQRACNARSRGRSLSCWPIGRASRAMPQKQLFQKGEVWNIHKSSFPRSRNLSHKSPSLYLAERLSMVKEQMGNWVAFGSWGSWGNSQEQLAITYRMRKGGIKFVTQARCHIFKTASSGSQVQEAGASQASAVVVASLLLAQARRVI